MFRFNHYKSLTAGLISLAIALLLSSCGSNNSGSSGGMQSYNETKTMVMDILKTEDGQKAINKAMKQQGESDGKMKLLSSPEGQQIQLAVKDVLTDPSYSKHLKEMVTDPKFAGEFAKAIEKENKQIQKDLMKDPEYQTMVITAMNNPEFKKMLLEVMKGPEYRKQAMTIMKESLESPLFRVEVMDLFKKVLEEETKPKEQKKKGGESKGGGGGGGGGSEGGGKS